MMQSKFEAAMVGEANQVMSPVDKGQRPDSRSAVVVGGGIVGCFSALYLRQRGYRVTILEKGRLGSGASTGNCGYLCPSHVAPLCVPGAIREAIPKLLQRKGALSIPPRFDPFLWRWLLQFATQCTAEKAKRSALTRHALLQLSDKLYRQLFATVELDCHWTQRGLLMVHKHPKTFSRFSKAAEKLRFEFGIDVRRYEGDDVLDIEPSLRDGLGGGWWFAADSHLDPGRLMDELRSHLIAIGVVVMEGTEVIGWDVREGEVVAVRSTGGNHAADHFVLTTGAEAPRLAKPLGVDLPLVPGKGFSMDFTTERPLTSVPMIFEDSHVATTPLGEKLRIGSTMQLTGYDRTLNPGRLQMIRDDAQSYLRSELPVEPDTRWAGWRPMMADDLPCIDRAPTLRNAWIAAGNGMIGLSTATGTGSLIAQMIDGEPPSIDVIAFAVDRRSGRKRDVIAAG